MHLVSVDDADNGIFAFFIDAITCAVEGYLW